jgi:vacuolar-type H+-ATPase subunit E/Vma4
VADAVAQAETAAHRDAALEAADARATAAAAVRDAREEALDTVLNAARARLAGGTVRLLDGALAQLLDEALAVLPAPQRVHVAARDERAAADALRRAGVQAQVVADLPTAGGVVLHGAGRRVDNTFEARLAAAWPRERSRLARSWDAGTTTDAGTATTGAAGAGSADP